MKQLKGKESTPPVVSFGQKKPEKSYLGHRLTFLFVSKDFHIIQQNLKLYHQLDEQKHVEKAPTTFLFSFVIFLKESFSLFFRIALL